MSTTLVVDRTFEAAHWLPHVPKGHLCGRMHGHSYRVEVHIEGPVHHVSGWVIDFNEVEQALSVLMKDVDHALLNDVQGLDNPTAEHLAAWFWHRLKPSFGGLQAVVVHESAHAKIKYTGPDGPA